MTMRDQRTTLLSPEPVSGRNPLDPDLARGHLAASVYLQMALQPHIIHIVGHTEAHHAATAQDVIEASKQCGRNILMQIHPVTDWPTYCLREDLPAVRLLAHPGGARRAAAELGGVDVCVAVGPEGGFSDSEVELARRAGWRIVSLGPRILRVETAALFLACLAASRAPQLCS